MKRTASAIWTGDLKQGNGLLNTQSNTLKDTAYSFPSRFENQGGTNPEELIAAAHAGCFCMALSAMLGKVGYTSPHLETNAELTLEQVNEEWTITEVRLAIRAKVVGLSEEDFKKYANEAKEKCPVSRVLKANISLEITQFTNNE